ncbi:hypothetical protein LJB85_01865 [Porphyromonadaceae bacterium OttesenSCG-928-L07]|nr:hypothetical protein [Porphyromonadaceae bacterium OttesenSCG-928-L07]MDL2251548.1 hypothetical protein [Odoribacter sp. OttesenSCG-928-J03]MDL2331080.1 hypothetical protein [Odoribacter sp. OttesenSCG-928-A06]
MHHSGPFSIPAFKDFVPQKLRPWIIVYFVIIFQLSSGGIYLAAVSEMVGSMALMQEDIMMIGYASMVGMALTFTIMFRLKFRFTSKTSLITCCIALITSNLICIQTQNIPLLVAVSFIAGIFRMWATFECNSTIQLWITPKRDLSVFFCFIYLLVQGCIQLSGLTTIYVAFLSKWEYMHWLMIGLLELIILLILILFRTHRSMKKLPLYGIDWLGALLWGGTVLCIIFICNYGEHYDWLQSVYIRMAIVVAIVTLLLNLWRASFIRHPFIELRTWRYPIVYMTFILYMVIDILLAPSHILEHIYIEQVLGYDSLHSISLNWIVLLGVIIGCLFTYLTFVRRKWAYKSMTVAAFTAITASLLLFYFTLDYNQSKMSLILPIFFRSFGYVIIAICFLTALSRVPFQHFFQAITIQSFISACIGGVLGTALLGHALKVLMKKNLVLLSADIDHVNSLISRFSPGEIYGKVQLQSLMVSMKELYGWLVLVSLICLLLFMIKESSIRPQAAIHPTYRSIRRFIKHQLKRHPSYHPLS